MRFSMQTFTALVLAAGIPAAAEDLTIISKVTKDNSPPGTSTSYLASDHVRMAQPDGEEFLLDLTSGQMTILDGKKKEYYVITKQDMEQLKAKMQEQMNSPEMKQAQEKMKNLPPETQKKMEEMMGGIMGSFNVQKTGAARKIAGYNCETWTITLGQFSKTEECLTTELQFPPQIWDTYRDFAQSMSSMMSALGPMAKSVSQMQEKFKEMKGFPLATTTTTSIMGHSTSSSSEVTDIRRGPIPASAWDLPAGYKKVENPMLKALQRK
jgi:hypothetical protein